MLWTMNPAGWLYVVIISICNLVMALISVIGGSTVQALLPAILVNALVLIYCLLPSTRQAFGPAVPA
jgi:hypothetical protein